MTTELVIENNIFIDNRIYFPPEFREMPPPCTPISAISAVCTINDTSLFSEAVEHARHLLSHEIKDNAPCVFLCAQDCFREISAVVKARALWNSSSILAQVRKMAKEIGPVFSIQKDHCIRYYGLAKIAWCDALPALNAIRMTDSCFGLLGCEENLTEAFSNKLFSQGFGKNIESGVAWPELIMASASDRFRLIRVTGTHDDREASIDIFN